MEEFDFTMEYKSGRAKLVAEALLRKVELAATSVPTLPPEEQIREGMKCDKQSQKLLDWARLGRVHKYIVDGELLKIDSGCLYVPDWGNLCKDIIRECHNSLCAGHSGMNRTKALVECAYSWP